MSSLCKINDLEDIVKHYNPDIDVDENIMINILNELSEDINLLFKKFTGNNQRLFLNQSRKNYVKFIKKASSKYKVQYKKPILLYYYKKLLAEERIEENKYLELTLLKTPSRDISGINQITILTSPHPDGQTFSCKHDCFYCPNEPAHEGNNFTPQPRSYLYSEPAVQRANRNDFDASKQTLDRLKSLLICGHKCDKLEFIIEGGTFTEYPKKYLYNYFTDFIYTCNEFYNINTYGLSSPKLRKKETLEKEIKLNKSANVKIIGICIETRPDSILENDSDGIPWIKTLLSWGVTRLQLGVQHIDNVILKKINRGHNIYQVIKAIEICKNNCFKIDIHIMPDLPGSNPEKDKEMFDYIYETSYLQPDQMKIYPCEVVPWTKIKKWYEQGEYKPYGDDKKKIEDVLTYAMNKCPAWIRLPRVVRDIPSQYITGGLNCGNIRQNIEQSEKFKGSVDIRSREIGRHPEYDIQDAKLFIRKYEASNGIDYFISYESKDNKALFGFCRLRIPSNNYKNDIIYSETLKNKGLIRELHVYGSLMSVLNTNKNADNAMQHKGIGYKLLKTAENIALFKHYKTGIVVISGIGVRGYYEKHDYELEDNFMVKHFYKSFRIRTIICDILFIIYIIYYMYSQQGNFVLYNI